MKAIFIPPTIFEDEIARLKNQPARPKIESGSLEKKKKEG
jgi:hypothetical protein